ncbi:MAG: hypothetical protein PF638_04790 [Candidatus Delongbacteria bacterium]|nr:hypothetical protein [Candidatus Delongbacteria bacterium]
MKKVFSMLILILGLSLFAQTTPQGSGTEGNPYVIESLSNLDWVGQYWGNWNKYYIQANDIDVSDTQNWNSGAGWIPIGNWSTYFTGSYDGQGFSIDGLFINRPSDNNVGFFGAIDGGTVKNVVFTNVNITGSANIGGIVGNLDNSISLISNCKISGYVKGVQTTGGFVGAKMNGTIQNSSANCYVETMGGGGFAGNNSGGTISECYNYGKVASIKYSGETFYLGGFMGSNSLGSTVQRCFSGANVEDHSNTSSTGSVGGFAGVNTGSVITDCYSTGNVLSEVGSTPYLGGFAGKNINGANIYNSFSIGSVAGSVVTGGFVGDNYISNVYNSFWDTENSGVLTSQGGTGKTTLEMKDSTTFTDAGWDLNSVWDVSLRANTGYPILRWKYSGLLPEILTLSVNNIMTNSAETECSLIYLGQTDPTMYGACWNTTGSPTLSDSYTDEGGINVSENFSSVITNLLPNSIYYTRAFATNSNGTTYGDDISFKTAVISKIPPLSGDGTDMDPYHISSIENLYWLSQNSDEWDKHYIQTSDIDASQTILLDDGAGWWAIGDNHEISGWKSFTGSYDGQNHYINGLYVDRTNQCIGLFGKINGGTIQNIRITNSFIKGYSSVGGLAGISYSEIKNCYFTGTVQGTSSVGGLLGYNYGAVEECFSSGTINAEGATACGGLIGVNYSTLLNCYSTCDINGNASSYQIGGLIGFTDNYTDHPAIDKCFSSGIVTDGYDYIGGLIGINYQGYTEIANSFWDTETSGQISSDGGTAKTSAEMKSVMTYTDAGWDFTTVWKLDGFNNGGYPWLKWANFTDPQPSNISLNVVGTEATLGWDALSGADTYNVYSSLDPNALFPDEWTLEASEVSDTSWVDDLAAEGKKFYRIVAVNASK